MPFRKTFLTSDIFLHGFKTALAVIIGMGVSHALDINNSLWLILTILMVMGYQKHFGGALQRSYIRAIGTVLGAFIACITLLIEPNNKAFFVVVIFLSVWMFSYFANYRASMNDAGVLGALTTITILISPHSNLTYALIRIIEILSGILIALIVSKFVFPIHARADLLQRFGQTFRDGLNLYDIMYRDIKVREKLPQVQHLEERIMKNFSTIDKLIPDAKNELSRIPYNKPIAESMVNYQRRLYRSMIFMYQALNKEPDKFSIIKKIPMLDQYNEAVMEILNQLADSIEGKGTLPSADKLALATGNLEKSIQKNHKSRPIDTIINIDTVLFCTKHMTDEISVLQMLIGTYRTL